ncbi:MAG: MBL fold metallo-hydrolase [Rikenellaceae bacterium]
MIKKNELLSVVRKNWAGNRLVDGKFVNINRKPSAMKAVGKWRIPIYKERSIINYGKEWQPEVVPLESVSALPENSLVWLGHNSFLMNLGGSIFIFDPVFGHIPFVRRKSQLPLEAEKFESVDYLLLSHDHYDHTDKKSVKLLSANNPHLQVVAGLGLKPLILKWVPYMKVSEMGWYQQIDLSGVKVTFLPSQHWGKRYANDGAKRLWGAFMIEVGDIKIYYSGDTGFANHFLEVKELFGEVDYAIFGIGAYKPRWFMERNHISPIEALEGAQQMGAKITIPMHYGTFKLSQEPLFDPPIVFRAEALKRDMNILIPNIGEIVKLKKQ